MYESFDSAGLEAEPSLADRLDSALVRLDDWRRRPGVAALVVLAVVAVASGAWWLGRTPSTTFVDDQIPLARLEPTVASTVVEGPIVVHVAGAVQNPGVYSLDPGSRVTDAVAAAGGVLEGADTDQLNLASLAADGMQVRVPLEGETLPALSSAAAGGLDGNGMVNINQASEAELETLPGIGPATAAAIAAWRADNGPFVAIEDLQRVPGIGPAKLAGLKDQVALQ